jgi:hypothetical protein
MFGNRNRSYRELPLRLADFGVLHRNEFSGALQGLTRVRRFQQDDAHIFCRCVVCKGGAVWLVVVVAVVVRVGGWVGGGGGAGVGGGGGAHARAKTRSLFAPCLPISPEPPCLSSRLSPFVHLLPSLTTPSLPFLTLLARRDQVRAEIGAYLKMMGEVYDIFGLDYKMALSTRPEGYLGDLEVWNEAEAALEEALNATGRQWEVRPCGWGGANDRGVCLCAGMGPRAKDAC